MSSQKFALIHGLAGVGTDSDAHEIKKIIESLLIYRLDRNNYVSSYNFIGYQVISTEKCDEITESN